MNQLGSETASPLRFDWLSQRPAFSLQPPHEHETLCFARRLHLCRLAPEADNWTTVGLWYGAGSAAACRVAHLELVGARLWYDGELAVAQPHGVKCYYVRGVMEVFSGCCLDPVDPLFA